MPLTAVPCQARIITAIPAILTAALDGSASTASSATATGTVWVQASTMAQASLFCGDLLAQIKRLCSRRVYRHQSEDRWFLDQMREALEAALSLEAPFLVVSISECLGGTRHDNEIKAAIEKSMDLAKRSD